MVIATDAGPFFTHSDLRPEREEQNPNAGQPHEDTPVKTEKNKGSSSAIYPHWDSKAIHFQVNITIDRMNG